MSEDPCPTYLTLGDGRRLHFEDYLVREGAPADVEGVDLGAARAARPAPGVIAAIEAARLIVVCPSNPVVSIGPILAVQGVRAAIDASSAPVVAISPIVGGAPIKGPADTLLRAIAFDLFAHGVALHYRPWIDAIVIDDRDAEQREAIEALGLACVAVDTIMRDRAVSARLAGDLLELAARVSK